jgi:hypothetical protein
MRIGLSKCSSLFSGMLMGGECEHVETGSAGCATSCAFALRVVALISTPLAIWMTEDRCQLVLSTHTGLSRPAALLHSADSLMSRRQPMYSALSVAEG